MTHKRISSLQFTIKIILYIFITNKKLNMLNNNMSKNVDLDKKI